MHPNAVPDTPFMKCNDQMKDGTPRMNKYGRQPFNAQPNQMKQLNINGFMFDRNSYLNRGQQNIV